MDVVWLELFNSKNNMLIWIGLSCWCCWWSSPITLSRNVCCCSIIYPIMIANDDNGSRIGIRRLKEVFSFNLVITVDNKNNGQWCSRRWRLARRYLNKLDTIFFWWWWCAINGQINKKFNVIKLSSFHCLFVRNTKPGLKIQNTINE